MAALFRARGSRTLLRRSKDHVDLGQVCRTMASKTPVGFIGLGNMGIPMALNLLKSGYPIIATDVFPESGKELQDQGAQILDSPAEVADKADRIITMLPKIKKGTLLIDSSTIDPSVAKEMALASEKMGQCLWMHQCQAQIESHGLSMGSSLIGSAHSSSCSSPQFPSLHSEAKQRLKAALGHHSATPTARAATITRRARRPNRTPHCPPQTPPHTPQHSGTHSQVLAGAQSGGRRRRGRDDDPDDRRQKFLERNRAAATRCRQKRKVWVVSLEKKAEELSHTNLQLQNEVTQLKTEVTQLKHLLVAHRDCPVTTRQKEARGYHSAETSPSDSSTLSCSQQQVLQHNSISTSTCSRGQQCARATFTHCH
ncbi:hypothetical protein SKAU_G00407590 [Synaphobranchus kaupii]|uniref:BZIP domain-containing protein n=1 Tax=Synaphobranchus kaupii TaxID=118154 RepID=A0A9Q1EAC9_SYNKA|nr:hypothetical protein SKAU_G00407590 [Synaphobranchus kaupii]